MTCASIPTCFFPSTVLFVANQQDDWLKEIAVGDPRFTAYIVDSPAAAVAHLNQQCSDADQLTGLCTDHSFVAHQAPGVVDPASETLVMVHAEMYNPLRFNEVSVLIVDSTLLTTDVFDFCRSLDHYAIKIMVLITTEQLSSAVIALASGWIDAYITQDTHDLPHRLIENIYRLQEKYFQCMSKIVLKLLKIQQPECLSNPDFVRFFQDVCAQHLIVEYYLVDISGGFLLINAAGKVSLLLIKRQSELPLITEFAAAHGASNAVLESIRSGQKIPGILAQELRGAGDINWSHLLVPAEHRFFNDAYETAYVSGHSWYDANYKKLCSYQHYLNEIHSADCLLTH